jgi:pimeloyl-ACP methyl ester carboxylesterase
LAVPTAQAEEVFLDVQGTRVRVQRKGSGSPVLVLHGEEGVGQWHPLYEQLSRRHQVLVPEHPGMGQSDQPAWLESIQDVVYHELDLLDAMGLEQVNVVGESFGGWLAAELAVGHTPRIRKLVLIGPYGVRPAGTSMPDIFAMSGEQLAQATYHDQALAARVAEHRPSREELERQLRDKATLSRVGWNPYLEDPQLQVWLRRVTCPTLLIWGAQDRIVPVNVAQAWLARLPDATLHVVENAGHLPQVERADEVARAVSAFLGS